MQVSAAGVRRICTLVAREAVRKGAQRVVLLIPLVEASTRQGQHRNPRPYEMSRIHVSIESHFSIGLWSGMAASLSIDCTARSNLGDRKAATIQGISAPPDSSKWPGRADSASQGVVHPRTLR